MTKWVENNNAQWVDSDEEQWAVSGYVDLGASVFGITTGGVRFNLGAYINVIYTKDLNAIIRAFTPSDLGALINVVQPVNLPASIHGWDTKNLTALTAGVYGPGDLQASIVGTGGYRNMEAYVRGMLGTEISRNLIANLIGTYSQNLQAIIGSIPPKDLQALITATGQAVNLPASIVPRVIYMTQVLEVALLEHKNLHAMINSLCFSSGSLDLNAYTKAIYKLDLQGIIFGWHIDIYSNVIDLAAAINTADFSVEDKLPISFFGENIDWYHTRLKIGFNATGPAYTVWDTQDIIYGAAIYRNLAASITGVLESINLGATITAVFDFNYTELPYYVSPRTREVVIEFDHRWREKTRRFVEIFFDNSGNTPYHYFYVSGTNKVYRVDRTRHWTIWAKGFDQVDTMIERRNVRHKFIFKASQYANVDEAIRDLIDRVSYYRRANLSAFINGILPPNANLTASINPVVPITPLFTLRDLGAIINGVT